MSYPNIIIIMITCKQIRLSVWYNKLSTVRYLNSLILLYKAMGNEVLVEKRKNIQRRNKTMAGLQGIKPKKKIQRNSPH